MTLRKLTDISRAFHNDDFKFVDPKTRKEYCFPNSWLWNEKERVSILVVWRSDAGSDFAVNKFALEYFRAAAVKGTVRESYVILADGKEGGEPEYVTHVLAPKLLDALRGHPHQHGQFGDYWWVDEHFQFVNNPPKREYAQRPF